MELHPLCTLFPRLPDAELQSLADDIRAHGLREPIVTHGGMILDGGNRWRACELAGVMPTTVEYTGPSLVAFVLSANLHRRHLSPGQQAAIVAAAQDWAKAQPVGNPAFRKQSCNVAPLETAAGRAAESGASLRTQKMADKVAKASPDLARKVAHGEISLPAAVRQVDPPRPREQEPAPVSEPAPAPADHPMFDAGDFAAALQELDDLRRIVDAEEPLAEARKLIAELRRELEAKERQYNGAMADRNDLIRANKSLQRRLRELSP